LWLSVNISNEWGIDFIKNVIQHFKPKNKEYSYLFNMGIRCIVSTQHWKESINEIIWFIENLDNIYVIDFLAYFKWKRTTIGEDELFQLIKSDNNLIQKINGLKSDIENRYANNYFGLNEN